MGTRRRSTLRDVAQRAGVSVGTASGVFTANSSVSAQARAAVLAAASEIGYHPRRRPAQPFAAGVTTFGLLARAAHYVGPANPFYGPVLYGAQWAVGDLGLSLALETLHDGNPHDGRPHDGRPHDVRPPRRQAPRRQPATTAGATTAAITLPTCTHTNCR